MAPSGVGVLAIRLASIGPSADVELVVENAGTTLGVAGQRVGSPCRRAARSCPIASTAARGRYALLVKAADYAAGPHARGIVFEDPHDDRGLRRYDLLQTFGTFAAPSYTMRFS